ncbi:MAG TPA: hypothetical protein VMI75_21960 [Polyangiaceae bacterium]|nr:hypothetical protein [Polyangiaceae bacterium]
MTLERWVGATAVTLGVMLASPSALAQDATPTDLGRIPAYVVGGLAVVTLGVGAVFGGLSVADHREFVQHPTAATANRGDSHEIIADMCFGGAATLAVAAVVMFLTHQPPAPASVPATSRVTWSPLVGQHAAGAGASISF